jgi:hypothetical protein
LRGRGKGFFRAQSAIVDELTQLVLLFLDTAADAANELDVLRDRPWIPSSPPSVFVGLLQPSLTDGPAAAACFAVLAVAPPDGRDGEEEAEDDDGDTVVLLHLP